MDKFNLLYGVFQPVMWVSYAFNMAVVVEITCSMLYGYRISGRYKQSIGLYVQQNLVSPMGKLSQFMEVCMVHAHSNLLC